MVDIMGCDNWIMEVIGDIATLDASKHRIASDEFFTRKENAEQRLIDGIESLKIQEVCIIVQLSEEVLLTLLPSDLRPRLAMFLLSLQTHPLSGVTF